MKQADYIKQIAKFALANDNARLRDLLYQYVEYSQQNNRGKFATEILSIIKDSDRENSNETLEFRYQKNFTDSNVFIYNEGFSLYARCS